MAIEGQLLSEYHGTNPLLQDVHGFLQGFVPKYVEALQETAEHLKDILLSSDAPVGWGVYGNNGIIFPELFTGRNYCLLSTNIFIQALFPRFPRLDITFATTKFLPYGAPSLTHFNKRNTVEHFWLQLNDKNNLQYKMNGVSTVLDGTIRQFVPEGPFVLMSDDLSRHISGDTSYENVDKPYDPYTLFSHLGEGLDQEKQQSLERLLRLGSI